MKSFDFTDLQKGLKDPQGSMDHSLKTTVLDHCVRPYSALNMFYSIWGGKHEVHRIDLGNSI